MQLEFSITRDTLKEIYQYILTNVKCLRKVDKDIPCWCAIRLKEIFSWWCFSMCFCMRLIISSFSSIGTDSGSWLSRMRHSQRRSIKSAEPGEWDISNNSYSSWSNERTPCDFIYSLKNFFEHNDTTWLDFMAIFFRVSYKKFKSLIIRSKFTISPGHLTKTNGDVNTWVLFCFVICSSP